MDPTLGYVAIPKDWRARTGSNGPPPEEIRDRWIAENLRAIQVNWRRKPANRGSLARPTPQAALHAWREWYQDELSDLEVWLVHEGKPLWTVESGEDLDSSAG